MQKLKLKTFCLHCLYFRRYKLTRFKCSLKRQQSGKWFKIRAKKIWAINKNQRKQFSKAGLEDYSYVLITHESEVKTVVMKNVDKPILNESFKALHQLCRHTTTVAFLTSAIRCSISCKMCGFHDLRCSPCQPLPCHVRQIREPLRPCIRIVKS